MGVEELSLLIKIFKFINSSFLAEFLRPRNCCEIVLIDRHLSSTGGSKVAR